MTAEQREHWRPAICPDRAGCAPLIHPMTDSDNLPAMDNPTFAIFCFGRLTEERRWTFNGVEHVEDLSTCQYSPLKGVIRWLENVSDWAALQRAYRAAIPAANESVAVAVAVNDVSDVTSAERAPSVEGAK